ncbi:MAG: hypothetical protein J0I07_03010 [Myxococcales bacterium]|nr:hypothetical protein [Myxococcales bacterium]
MQARREAVTGRARQRSAESSAATRAALAQNTIAEWKSLCSSSQPVKTSPPNAPKVGQ